MISAILICLHSIDAAAIIAFLFPFAPACARPLNTPTTITLSPAIISAPSFTSPKITILPSYSILFPERTDPLKNLVSEDSISLLKDFFNDLGIEEFKYVFGTHAHEDHIGGLDDVIKNFKVKNFYMPEEVTTTQTFVEILDALEAKKIKFQTPKAGTRLKLGDSTVEVIYVGDNKEELNDTSIIIKLTYKDTSFLFTGDATSNEEKLFLDKDIQSDVLKVGHHGSRYSSSQSFLNKVNPNYAIITCAKGNDYDFPHNSTLKRLDKVNAKVYRTDNLGTIIVKSDGKNLTFENVKTKLDGV